MSSPVKPKARVLVVDDDQVFRHTLCAELHRSGYDVMQAADDAEFRAALAERDVEVLLLDLRFPNADGLSMLEHVKRVTEAEVIVLTGHGTVQTAIQAMKLGAADYLTKPCDLDELELTIERTLETRKLKLRTAILESGLARAETELVGRSPGFMKMMSE
ncbi:MAG: response regulator, partial [Deltaproteobacteria bacterium]|nr:response regulator [Deltaproteobacteria bacterium]